MGRTLKDASSFPVESNPPRPCPKRCGQHRSCAGCLASAGGEGGWQECRWSDALAQVSLAGTPSFVHAPQRRNCHCQSPAGSLPLEMSAAGDWPSGRRWKGSVELNMLGLLQHSCILIGSWILFHSVGIKNKAASKSKRRGGGKKGQPPLCFACRSLTFLCAPQCI